VPRSPSQWSDLTFHIAPRKSALLLVLAVASCIEAPTPLRAEAPEKMGRPYPADAEIRRDPAWDTIRSLKGENLSADLEQNAGFRELQTSGQFDAIALSFLAFHASAFRLDDPENELAVRSIKSDDLGFTHVKFEQHFRDLSIPGAELIVHLDRANRVYLVNGSYIATPRSVNTMPAFGQERARQIAAEMIDARSACAECPCDLVILAQRGHPPRLAYRVYLALRLTEGWELMLDAQSGALLRKLPTVLSKSPQVGLRTVKPPAMEVEE
jgi:Zn-dependent metalloprotease